MLSKLYAFIPVADPRKPQVAALGLLNSKSFEDACLVDGVPFRRVTEAEALDLLVANGGIGCGCYSTIDPLLDEEAMRFQARQNNVHVAAIINPMAIDPPIKLEPIKLLLVA